MRLSSTPCLAAITLALAATACGASTDETGEPEVTGPSTVDDTARGGSTATDPDPTAPGDTSDITGLAAEDNRTSPCVGLDTGWAGDELCILPPDPSEGFQYHVGPDDYDDPDEIARFTLPAGTETVECYWEALPLDHDIYNRQRNYRMRPGSHHLILKKSDTPQAEGWAACPGGLTGSFGGSQNSVNDTGFREAAPEYAGYASLIEANLQGAAEMHYFNATDEPVLRDVWVNFYEADPDTVTGTMHGLSLIGLKGLEIGPNSNETLRYGCATDVDRRIAGVVGHVHSHTTRFSAWTVRGSGERELIYELYDWAEPLGIDFNSVTTNTLPGLEYGLEGGRSGILSLSPGDSVEWECEVVNDLDTALLFGNEALTAEMCILFGRSPEASWSCLPDRM